MIYQSHNKYILQACKRFFFFPLFLFIPTFTYSNMTTSPDNTISNLQWLFNGAPGKVVVFHQPQIAFQPVCHVKAKGKITTTYSIKDGNIFHKIRTTNDILSLFVIKYFNTINYIVGSEKASAYRNNDGYPQTNLTVTPTLLVAGDKMVSAGSVVSLFTKSELLKYVINNYPNTELVKSDLSLEDVHEINQSLFKTFGKNTNITQYIQLC